MIGEVYFDGLLGRFDNPQHRYKLANLLQLETETKTGLRPTALELGVEVAELDGYRKLGHNLPKSQEGMDWKTMMSELVTVVEPVVKNYIEIAAIAPPEYKDVADSMVVHETAILTCARLEASGDTEHSLDDVIKELKFPMKPTSRTSHDAAFLHGSSLRR